MTAIIPDHVRVRPTQTRVVFLDIDGVLITLEHRHLPDPMCVAELNRITDTTGAVIVVSSSRRAPGTKAMAKALRSWGVTGHVAGITPDLSFPRNSVYQALARGVEIQAWLDAHPATRSWVILDDEADMAGQRLYLVQTAYSTGLTRELADATICHLECDHD